MNDDAKLLRAYIGEKSEEAFTELVRRHVGLVYSVALRRVGRDSHLAEDVTQVVFSDLARKAKSLLSRPTLSGWLYVSAQVASAAVVRKESRRKRREEASIIMQEIQDAGEPKPDWDRIRPLLDELIVRLEGVDREAIVLRFYEKRSFAEIGASLHLTDDTARKRVERALGKLRSSLAKSGFVSGAATFSELLAGELATPPPGGLAAKVAGTALSEFATAAVGTSVLMSMLNALQPGVLALTALGLGLPALLIWQHRSIEALRSEAAVREERESEIHSLRVENGKMARLWAQTRYDSHSRKNTAAKSPKNRPPIVSADMTARKPFPVSSIWVRADGTVGWNGATVTLEEFLEQLTAYRARDPDPRGTIVVIGEKGTPFSAYAYAVEQASKADIKDITLSTPPSPTASDMNWLSANSDVTDVLPPTLPDPPAKH